jgi:hypothetical protein
MSMDSIIMDTSMTSSWCVSWCCFSTCSTFVKGTIPFEMGRIAAFKTLILLLCIILTIGSQVGVIGSRGICLIECCSFDILSVFIVFLLFSIPLFFIDQSASIVDSGLCIVESCCHCWKRLICFPM